MSISHGYCSLDELKAAMDITDDLHTTALETAIEDASRLIDDYCDRIFYAAGSSTRYFTAGRDGRIRVDWDLLTVTAITTDNANDRTYSEAWVATDYELEPVNKGYYREIRTTPNGTRSFPSYGRAVKVTGTWGRATVPNTVRRACLIQAEALYKSGEAPFGIVSMPEGSGMRAPGLDARAKALLVGERDRVFA